MKKARFAGAHDYLAVLVRRKRWFVVTFIALCALTTLLSSRLPKIYVSETMLQIQPREVPTEFVKDLIAGTTDERLSSIEQTILSRTNLLRILSQFDSEMPSYKELNDERRVLKLRGQIQIEFISERVGGRPLPIANIRIAYRDQNPELAQKIAGRLASLFIEQETRAREIQVFGTTEFLTSELNKVGEQLRQSQDRLKSLKEHFRYELPSELDTNLRTLDRLQLQKTGNAEAVDRYMTMQLNLERQISETAPMITRESAPVSVGGAISAPRNPLVDTYKKKDQEYNELLAKSTEKHPDVLRLKAELDQLKKDIPPEDLVVVEKPDTAQAQPVPVYVPNPVYQNLTGQLRQVKTEIEIREREKKWIDAEMARYNERVQNTPHVEQEMAAITRTNDDLTKQHDDLKIKLSQAKLSESLESRQKGGQFAIIDAANFPLEPATPSRKVVLLVGCLISLGLGLVAALGVGILDQRVWTQPELERFLGGQVLVEIPNIVSPSDLRRERRSKLVHAAVLVVCMGAWLGGLGYLYLRQPTALRVLDPVMEKLMERMVRQ
ncbi:MAG TPA: hypothetical protein VE398_02035 [Acidobacteriota bacterium]|nr:hypothetical protein [Acidobacteriota bacterium]